MGLIARNVMLRAIVTLAVALGLVEIVAPGAHVGAAGEAAGRAERMQSMEAECKYVLDLCARSKRRDATFLTAKKNLEHDSSVENIDRYRDSFTQSSLAFTEFYKAAKTLLRKNGKPLKCLDPCSALLGGREAIDLP